MTPNDAQRARYDLRLSARRLDQAARDRAFHEKRIGRVVAKGHLAISDAAAICGVSPRTIRRWRDKATTT